MHDVPIEAGACIPIPLEESGFNPHAIIPYGCSVEYVRLAMLDFIEFLQIVNLSLYRRGLARLESMLMPANFSSLVSEFMGIAIPKYCTGLHRNLYHNGHPDLIPTGKFPNNAVQYAHEGIELKASRRLSGWQGHNAESIWLMVFCFDSNTSADISKGIKPKSFRFRLVAGAQLEIKDWAFSGRLATSRRTITASVTQFGRSKMLSNWIYRERSSKSDQ
ncbi:MAG: hypothetical protein ACYDBJ_20900 [Aggregatilineales bacterium]